MFGPTRTIHPVAIIFAMDRSRLGVGSADATDIIINSIADMLTSSPIKTDASHGVKYIRVRADS